MKQTVAINVQENEILATDFYKFRLNRLNRSPCDPPTCRFYSRLARLRDPSIRRRPRKIEFTPGFSHGSMVTSRIPRGSTGKSRPDERTRAYIEKLKSLWRVGGDQVPFQEYSIRFADVISANGPFGPCCQRLSIIGKFLAPVCVTLHLVPFHRPIVSLGSRPLLLWKDY